LLNAYAFWQIGQIALYAAIAAFVGGAIFLVLSIIGFLHMRRTPAQAELQPARSSRSARNNTSSKATSIELPLLAKALMAGFHRIAYPVPVGSRDGVTRERHFSVGCSVGKWPRALTARPYRAISRPASHRARSVLAVFAAAGPGPARRSCPKVG
jgi:hypothetical protein